MKVVSTQKRDNLIFVYGDASPYMHVLLGRETIVCNVVLPESAIKSSFVILERFIDSIITGFDVSEKALRSKFGKRGRTKWWSTPSTGPVHTSMNLTKI